MDIASMNVVTGTYDVAVAGDRMTVAHGLTNHVGRGVVPDLVLIEAQAPDADGALTEAVFNVVSKDATNVVIRGTQDAVNFTMVAIRLRNPVAEGA